MGAQSKIFPLFIVVSLLCTGLVGTASEERTIKHDTIKLNFTNPDISEEGEYITIEMQETTSLMTDPGNPLIPFTSSTFTFPLGTKIKDIAVTYANTRETRVQKKILPASQPVPADGEIYPITHSENSEIYGTDIAYPQEDFTYQIFGGIEQGKQSTILTVHSYPIRYYPLSGKLEISQEIIIDVDYNPTTLFSAIEEKYDLVILTPQEYKNAMTPLVSHKAELGISTKIVTLDEIPALGVDEPESIKYYIKQAIENWGTRFVLLVGDRDSFPVRYTHIELSDDNEVFSSDLYYADIYNDSGAFSNWDSNNNGVFGEYEWEGNTDTVDLYPDVYLGRLACVNEEQAITAVNKIITYETSSAYTQDWFSNIITVGGDTVPGDREEIDEGEYMNQKIIEVMDGFNSITVWASTNDLSSVGNIESAINQGAGFIDFSGHGSPTSYATHPHEKENTWIPTGGFKSRDIDDLTNNDKLPIVITSACSTSKFTKASNSFSWSFVANPNGGAIATCGCTGLGYIYIGKSIAYGLVGKMELESFRSYRDDNAITFGEMWGKTISSYIKDRGRLGDGDHKTIEEWQAFGDPSLAIASTSQIPFKPFLEGPSSGKKNTPYTYNASTTDPEGDKIYYWFDWGDDSTSGWIGPFASGTPVTSTHTWESRGSYFVRVKAKDEHGGVSDWSDPLEISLPLKFSMTSGFEEGYIYLFGQPIFKTLWRNTILIGRTNIKIDTYDKADKVGFYIDGGLRYMDKQYPFEWLLDEPLFGKHTLSIIPWFNDTIQDEITYDVWVLNVQ